MAIRRCRWLLFIALFVSILCNLLTFLTWTRWKENGPSELVMEEWSVMMVFRRHQASQSSSSLSTELTEEKRAAYLDKIEARIKQGSAQYHRDLEASPSSMGACLLVMDENHRLPEWLAYHYYTLPLRRLVVMVDPRSETSPLEILNRWRPYMDEITVWYEADLGMYHEKSLPNDNQTELLVKAHRVRQYTFYQKCLKYYRAQQQEQQLSAQSSEGLERNPFFWVTFHDVDEYVYLDRHTVPDALERMQQPGSILQVLREIRQSALRPRVPFSFQHPKKDSNVSSRTTHLRSQRHNDSNLFTSKTSLKLLSRDVHQQSCLVVSRTLYGSIPSTLEKQMEERGKMPNASDALLNISQSLETLQWHYRASHRDYSNNGRGKSLVQVWGPEDVVTTFPEVPGPHVLLQACSTSNTNHGRITPVRIRHYLGSWSVYTHRTNDARVGVTRTREAYEYRSQFMGRLHYDADIQPWLVRFCAQVGEAACLELLQGAGQLPHAELLDISEWHMTPNQIQQAIQQAINKPRANRRPPGGAPSFAEWLEQEFQVETLGNGTVTATRRPSAENRSESLASRRYTQ